MRRLLVLPLVLAAIFVLAWACLRATPSPATPVPLDPQRLSPPVLTSDACTPLIGESRTFLAQPADRAAQAYLGPGGLETEKGKGTLVFFVDGQLLISGRPENIEKVVAETNRRLQGRAGDGLVFSRGDDVGPINRLGFDTRLYRFTPAKIAAPAVVATVRQVSGDLGLLVLADLNLLAAPTLQPKGCEVAGSPLSGEDSPLSGEDSPLWGAGGYIHLPGAASPDKLFWDQWALADIKPGGIHVSDSGAARPGIATGKGTQIVILDTSPFTGTGLATFSGPGWMKPTLQVCVEHPVDVSANLADPCGTPQDSSDHGIFVAGLAHAAAPDARLDLIRVLNGHGRGDLRTTLYALANLDRGQLNKTKTVINMSLGFTPEPGGTPASWQEVCKQVGFKYCSGILDLLDHAGELSPSQVAALQNALQGAVLETHVADLLREGVVVVAAAGNHGDANNVPPAEMPASFAKIYPSGVIAAAATTSERVRTFYSHAGTIAAPGGGDNTPGCAKAPGVTPAGAAAPCWGKLDDWVISVATHPSKGGSGVDWGYGAWAGTSFAAPLVSGMVAGAFPSRTAPQTVDTANKEVCPPPNAPAGALGHGIVGYCP